MAAGVLIALGLTSSVLGPIAERGQFQGETALSQARSAASAATALQSQFDAAKGNAQSSAAADNIRGLLEDREVWNWLVRDVHSALDSSDPQRELLSLAGDFPLIQGKDDSSVFVICLVCIRVKASEWRSRCMWK